MTTIHTEDLIAVSVVTAIRTGDLTTLRRLLAEIPGLATARLGDDDPDGMSRSLLHVAADWPGHYPNGAATVATIVDAATLGLLDRVEAYFSAANPTRSRGRHPRFLGCLPRRTATLRRVPSRTGRRAELDSALGEPHPPGRRRTGNRRRAHRMASPPWHQNSS